jgi:hypothetical protein
MRELAPPPHAESTRPRTAATAIVIPPRLTRRVVCRALITRRLSSSQSRVGWRARLRLRRLVAGRTGVSSRHRAPVGSCEERAGALVRNGGTRRARTRRSPGMSRPVRSGRRRPADRQSIRNGSSLDRQSLFSAHPSLSLLLDHCVSADGRRRGGDRSRRRGRDDRPHRARR